MTEKFQLVSALRTSCPHCCSHYRITCKQLKAAFGQVQCGVCNKTFNALATLENLPDRSESYPSSEGAKNSDRPTVKSAPVESGPASALSLHEAMYGQKPFRLKHIPAWLLFCGIALLLVLGAIQALYYYRYQLLDNRHFQSQVLAVCTLLPCNEFQFSSTGQIKLVERHVFTHPVTPRALMVTGAFVNQASFPQKLPNILVSLFDTQGNLTANRMFEPREYRFSSPDRVLLARQGQPVRFRLEVVDPGIKALTYEFEFF